MYTPLNWTTTQRHVAFASFTSWMLDAFDFFILVFVLSDLAEWFHASVSEVSIAIMLTLAVRPIGALLFGRMAEKYGRRPILMLNILFFTVFELLSAWSPTFMAFLIFRVMYGVAMGGIWGVASSLAMETIPDRSRGLIRNFSGGLSLRLSVRLGHFWPLLQYGRLARYVPDWRPTYCLAALYLV